MAANAPPPTQSSLEIAVREFIPKELIPTTWKCDKKTQSDNLQDLINKAAPHLAMFGTVEDLFDHVATYVDFPNSYDLLKMNIQDPLELKPSGYDSMKQKWCLYRTDLHKIFNYRKVSPLKPAPSKKAARILESCWKILRGGDHHKMFICREEPETPTAVKPDFKAFGTAKSKTEYEVFKKNWKEDADKSINILSGHILDEMEKILASKSTPNYQEAAHIIICVGLVFQAVKEFVQDENIDLPPLYSVDPEKKPKEVIRLFSNDKYAFMMAHDLLEVLEKTEMDSDTLKKLIPEELRKEKLSTITYEQILRIMGAEDKYLKNLEFAKMKCNLLMFVRSPIPTCDGGYCILAMDVLYQLLMDMVMAKKVFHTPVLKKDWDNIAEFFKSMESHFDINKDIYFVYLDEQEEIMKKWEEFYTKNLKKPNPKPKLLVIPKKDTYTVTNIERALRDLDMKKYLGNIGKYAEPVYKKLTKKSPNNLHLAIARCQINGLVRKVPRILEFIHKQEFCQRMDIADCEHCKKASIGQVVEGLAKLDAHEKL